MIRSCSCLVLAAAFQTIFGQAEQFGLRPPPPSSSVPDHCLSPPPGIELHKCCLLPPMFDKEDLKRCGIEKASMEHKNTPQIDQTKEPCHESKCLMRNANLLLANQSVDYEKFRAFMDKWASKNPDYTEAVTAAMRFCAYDGRPSGPPVCEQDRVFICLTSIMLWNCKIQDLDGAYGCRILKEHMEECRPFFFPKYSEEDLLSQEL